MMQQHEVSGRIATLKKRLLDTDPTICLERARIYTAVYERESAQPVIIRRAMALRETLERMTIHILEGELIVGNQASRSKAAPIFPEYAVDFLLEEIDAFEHRPGDRFSIADEQKDELVGICSLWKGKTLQDHSLASMTAEMRDVLDSGIVRAEALYTSGDGHIAVNFPEILLRGIDGYRSLVQCHAERLDLWVREALRSSHFYSAVKIALDALSCFINRFSNLAENLADKEPDATRRDELRCIHRTCRRIASAPPQSFREALQLTYFIQLILQIESNGRSVSLGRMDQYLFPYYQRDVEEVKGDDASTVELLQCFWLKLLEINKIRPWGHTKNTSGSPLYQNVTIGGTTTDGRDATNPLSNLILWSVGELQIPQPNLVVRYHNGIDAEFLLDCIRVIEKGFGMPALLNDEIIIPALVDLGVEEADACEYSAIGCIEVAVPGKWGYRCTGMSYLNFMRIFLAALNGGLDTQSGKTFCRTNGTLRDFPDFDAVMASWKTQIEYFTRISVQIDTAVDVQLEELFPDVLCSGFVDDCLSKGKPIKEGGAKYDFVSGLQIGLANLANSLAAIRKLIFEEKKISPDELLAAIANDFSSPAGRVVQQTLLNRAPKFGNDDDYVDSLLVEAYSAYTDELEKYHNTRYGRGPIGGTYYAGTSSVSANVPSGAVVGATPDGRHAFKPLAEGCSPTSGTDVNGPTAVFKSVAKLPTAKITGGVLLNQKFTPETIKSDSNKARIVAMIRAFFDDLKGWHIQYNVISRETLLAAQKNPEEYKSLVVRVAGYSAFFTVLSPETQDDIIARTEHHL